MKREFVEVNVAKEFAAEALGDPILIMGVNAILNKSPKFNLVFCEECVHSDNIKCSYGKVWCGKMCRYMNVDGFCSEGDNKNETD